MENTDFNHAFFKVLRYIYFHKNINKKNWFLLSWREYGFLFLLELLSVFINVT